MDTPYEYTVRYTNESASTKAGADLSGVADGARTHDNRNHNPGLYQLSYSHRKRAIIAPHLRRGEVFIARPLSPDAVR